MRLTLCEAPTRETRPGHYTGNSVPYSLQQVHGFFNVPCWLYNSEDAGDGACDLSSLSKKTRTSNRLQMSLQRQHVLLSYFKTLSVGPVWGLNPRPPTQQFGALPTELTGWWLIIFKRALIMSPRYGCFESIQFNPLSPKSDRHQISHCNINGLCKTERSWELSTSSGKMSLIDISTNSPYYFYWKSIGTVNENLNFSVQRVKSLLI